MLYTPLSIVIPSQSQNFCVAFASPCMVSLFVSPLAQTHVVVNVFTDSSKHAYIPVLASISTSD